MSLKENNMKKPIIFGDKEFNLSIYEANDVIGQMGGILFIVGTIFQFFVKQINNKLNSKKKEIMADQIQMQQIDRA